MKPRTLLHWDKDIREAFCNLSDHIREVTELVNDKNYELGITDNMICETLQDWIKEENKILRGKK